MDRRFFTYVKVVAISPSEADISLMSEQIHGDVTTLVCLDALRNAIEEVERAQLRYREASQALARIRGTLDQAVEEAYGQQSFGPLGNLFDKEEAALAVYEQAKAQLASAEEQWRRLGAALALEKEQALAGRLSRRWLN